MNILRINKIFKIYIYLGLALTVILYFLKGTIFSASGYQIIELVLVSAGLIVIPLGIKSRIQLSTHDKITNLLIFLYPLAGGSLLLSVFLQIGCLSGGLSIIWFLFSILVLIKVLKDLLLRGIYIHRETFIDIGLIYLSIGAVWFSASRFGFDLLGFSPFIVTLTAIHFHIAGLGASVVAGLIGRVFNKNNFLFYKISGTLITLTPIFVAIGINSSPLIEFLMSILLAIGIISMAIFVLKNTFSTTFNKLSALDRIKYSVLCLAQLISFSTMVLVYIFSYGELISTSFISYDQMVRYHGLFNYFAFILPSILILSNLASKNLIKPEKIPFQKLRGKRYIGVNYFKIENSNSKSEKGLYKNFTFLFNLGALNYSITQYFEDTANIKMYCKTEWQKGFRLISRGVHYFGKLIGQFVLPLNNNIYKINNSLFNQNIYSFEFSNPIASVRTYNDKSPMYIASYSSHVLNKKIFMNISLPIPFGQLHSILYLKNIYKDNSKNGLILSSFEDEVEHIGLWIDFNWINIKIPLREKLEIWDSSESKEAACLDFSTTVPHSSIAKHSFWVFGIKCLVLRYVLVDKKVIIRDVNTDIFKG